MFTALIFAISISFATLPLGDDNLQWGISEQALQEKYQVTEVNPALGPKHGYTEFSEVDPVVYIDRSTQGQKTEFYFHEGKLYKTLIIHLDQEDAFNRYESKIEKLKQELGPVDKQFQSKLFNMTVLHSVWDFKEEEYDLRFGAGYIYEVRTHKPAAKEKQIAVEMMHAI